MNGVALIIAAHGSRQNGDVNTAVCQMAALVAGRNGFQSVWPAFHDGTPSFADVLDQVNTDRVIVVPLLTSEGYFCTEVLPREVAANRRLSLRQLEITRPVGTHPRIAPLVARRARSLMFRVGMRPGDTTLLIIGHGTRRAARSRHATEKLAASLGDLGLGRERFAAFLDDEPAITDVVTRVATPNVLAIPFLISAGPHATKDVPLALGLPASSIADFPIVKNVHSRRIVCDRPIGLDPALADVILDRARESRIASVTSWRERQAS